MQTIHHIVYKLPSKLNTKKKNEMKKRWTENKDEEGIVVSNQVIWKAMKVLMAIPDDNRIKFRIVMRNVPEIGFRFTHIHTHKKTESYNYGSRRCKGRGNGNLERYDASCIDTHCFVKSELFAMFMFAHRICLILFNRILHIYDSAICHMTYNVVDFIDCIRYIESFWKFLLQNYIDCVTWYVRSFKFFLCLNVCHLMSAQVRIWENIILYDEY